MHNIVEFLSTKIKNKTTIPEIGTTAYDDNNNEWNIIDCCMVGDKDELRKFTYAYDAYNVFDELIDKCKDDDYLVAAEDSKFLSVFIWDKKGGLHYK